MVYMVTFTINIPQMLAYILNMDPMGIYVLKYPITHHFQIFRQDHHPVIQRWAMPDVSIHAVCLPKTARSLFNMFISTLDLGPKRLSVY